MTTGNIYTAVPLDLKAAEFRLLELHDDEVLQFDHAPRIYQGYRPRCTLRTVRLSESVPYIALSYTWGDPAYCSPILLNDSGVKVRENLYQFLTHAALYFWLLKQTRPLFWIDALYIDQDNVRERNHQVDLMRGVFSTASSVFVWLGLTNWRYSQRDFYSWSAKRLIINKATAVINLSNTNGATEFKGVLSEITFESRDTFNTRDALAKLHYLFDIPYWRRVWIIQEIMLAKQLTIGWDSTLLAWKKFEIAVQFLDRVRECVSLDAGPNLYLRDGTAAAIFQMKNEWDGKPKPLLGLLKNLRGLESTILMDKVFGLLGLADPGLGTVIDYDLPCGILAYKLILRLYQLRQVKTQAEAMELAIILVHSLQLWLPASEYAQWAWNQWSRDVLFIREE